MNHEQDAKTVKRIRLLKVPLDILQEEDLEPILRELKNRQKHQQIILLNFYDFMKSRRDLERQRMLEEAALVLPISKSLVKGALFLKKGEPSYHMPFEFVIRLLGALEKTQSSVYILGEKTRDLNISAANLRDSFPGLHIVGRHTGFFPASREKDVVLAIKKTTPTLLLAGSGLKGEERWIFRRKEALGAVFSLWCGECFQIFCGKAKKLSRKQWESRTRAVGKALRNPLRIFLIFPRIAYGILLLIYRLRKL